MAEISSVTTLDGTTYDIKDTVARSYHYMIPIATKTYSDFIASANDSQHGAFFYLRYRGTEYSTFWHIKTRVIATVPGQPNYYNDTVFDLYGWSNTYSWYSCVNRIKSTSYRPIYYNCNFRVSQTGYDNGCYNYIGVNLYASTNPTNTSYKRQIEVQLLACEGCEAEFLDSLVQPDNIPNRAAHTNWYTSTNTSFDNFDACNYGLKQTGDANTTNVTNIYRGSGNYIADSALYRYQLLFQVDENTLTPLNNVNNGYGSTTKAMLTDVEFDAFGEIYWYGTTSTVNAGAAIGAGSLYWAYNGVDVRYTFNSGTTLTAHKPLYLVVTPTSNGKCKIASSTPWANALPTTDDGNWYILLGRTYSTYQLSLYHTHPVYRYSNGEYVASFGAIPSDAIPMSSDLVGSAGASEEYARADHVHPISTDLVTSFELEFKTSTSDTDPYAGDTLPADPTDEDLDELWSSIAPTISGSDYLWQRSRVTYVNAEILRGTPSCISSVTERVEVATNLSNLSNEYYLSTSRTELVGGAWSDLVPALSPGHYIWTRIKMETVDGSSSYSDPMIHDALNSIADILSDNNATIEGQITDLSNDISAVEGSVTEINDWIETGAITKPGGTATQGVKIQKTDGSTPYATVFTANTAEIYENTDKIAEVANKKVNASAFRSNSVELSTSPFGGSASDWRVGSSASGFTIKWIGG